MEQQATTVSTSVTYLPLLNRRRLGEKLMKLQKNENPCKVWENAFWGTGTTVCLALASGRQVYSFCINRNSVSQSASMGHLSGSASFQSIVFTWKMKKNTIFPHEKERKQGIFENKMLVMVIGNNICLCYFFLMTIWLKWNSSGR